jgi:hypothetical protein
MATVTKVYDALQLHYQNGVGGISQQYVIEGLSATNDPADLLQAGVAASGISYTQAHPTIAGLYAATFDARPYIDQEGSTSRTAIRLIVGYSTPTFLPLGGVRVELSGSNSQFILNRWPDGAQKGQPILIGYNPDLTRTFPSQNNASIVKQGIESGTTNGDKFDTAEISIESPNAILILTRTEFAFPKQNFFYRRKLNKNAFLGFDPNTVLLRDVRAVNMVGAGTIIPTYYVVTYVFEITENSDQWVRVEFFRDQFTGKPIQGINILDGSNNGYGLVVPYLTADFGGLKFANNTLV